MSKLKIAIYGGAFNPPTIGHVRSVESVYLYSDIDEVWVMPSYTHRHGKEMVSFEDRLVMCELAFMTIEGVKVSSFEKVVGGNGSTVSLIQRLQKVYGNRYEFYFVIGQDNAENIEKWENYGWLLNNVNFIVLPRKVDKVKETWYTISPHRFIDGAPFTHVSSTMAREAASLLSVGGHYDQLKAEIKLDEILPKEVKEYGVKFYM